MKHSVLIFDDNPVVHGWISAALFETGFSLHHEFEAQHFVKRALELKPALILFALRSQEEARTISMQLRTENLSTPLVLMTPPALQPDAHSLSEWGIQEVLRKPFDAAALQMISKKFLDMDLRKSAEAPFMGESRAAENVLSATDVATQARHPAGMLPPMTHLPGGSAARTPVEVPGRSASIARSGTVSPRDPAAAEAVGRVDENSAALLRRFAALPPNRTVGEAELEQALRMEHAFEPGTQATMNETESVPGRTRFASTGSSAGPYTSTGSGTDPLQEPFSILHETSAQAQPDQRHDPDAQWPFGEAQTPSISDEEHWATFSDEEAELMVLENYGPSQAQLHSTILSNEITAAETFTEGIFVPSSSTSELQGGGSAPSSPESYEISAAPQESTAAPPIEGATEELFSDSMTENTEHELDWLEQVLNEPVLPEPIAPQEQAPAAAPIAQASAGEAPTSAEEELQEPIFDDAELHAVGMEELAAASPSGQVQNLVSDPRKDAIHAHVRTRLEEAEAALDALAEISPMDDPLQHSAEQVEEAFERTTNGGVAGPFLEEVPGRETQRDNVPHDTVSRDTVSRDTALPEETLQMASAAFSSETLPQGVSAAAGAPQLSPQLASALNERLGAETLGELKSYIHACIQQALQNKR